MVIFFSYKTCKRLHRFWENSPFIEVIERRDSVPMADFIVFRTAARSRMNKPRASAQVNIFFCEYDCECLVRPFFILLINILKLVIKRMLIP